ncbi:MAG: PPOX class F420-dependent oxidoreductase [Chloroflexales bacterium]
MSDAAHFATLEGAEFMVLTTHKRSGDAVPTTVWFAQVDDRLYLTTQSHAGKAKRIRATPNVMVAPSDRVGNVSGPAVAAVARQLGPEEAQVAEAALHTKYGDQYVAVAGRLPEGAVRVFIEVTA